MRRKEVVVLRMWHFSIDYSFGDYRLIVMLDG